MKHFRPESWHRKQDRHENKQSEDPTPEPPYEIYKIGLFNPRPNDRSFWFFLSTRVPVDVVELQRCMSEAYPWDVDVYYASKTVFLVEFKRSHFWRDIVEYTAKAWELLTD